MRVAADNQTKKCVACVELMLNANETVVNRSVSLFEQIEDSASIRKASRNLGISYRCAMQLIEELQQSCQTALVERRSGGGAGLTAEARRMISQYRATRSGVC